PSNLFLSMRGWIAVTGKSFGDKDFRSALENGILLCELLSAIKPGLVKKINRLPTPIAGLDNLSVFLRGCEELGLKGAQLFDPGDLQDTSIRANLKDSDCNRKLKNVLNTVYWLGKAASGCASYSGPTLNLKEFEGLLAQMKLVRDSSQKRSVRDSGYDCWDSERSESLSPPRHTRDNSLDSLDSFGSRSQHSPSPDVVNRGNSDGHDSEADAPNRKPDVRKDDMLARRTSSSESRSSIPFNQFLPNRTNATSYIPTPRRKPHTEDRDPPTMEEKEMRSVSMGDMLNEEEVGHLPLLSQSRHERMHEQYNSFLEEEDHWQDDLARWKNRRRSASQDLIRKEEERKRIEKRMKEQGSDGNKRKSIKTYKEIVEEKERREAELCDAYRNAATPEEAALVLQRYALRFTISDAVLDSLKLPRSTSKPEEDLNEVDKEHKQTSPVNNSEMSDHLHLPVSPVITNQEVIYSLRLLSSHKDGLVRVNGVATEELAVSTPPTSSQHSSQDTKDVSSKEADKDAPPVETVKNAETAEQQPPPPPQTEKSAPSSGSAISSLIGGRNCVITTTIVTELTQTVVEPLHPDIQNTGETPMLNLAKRVNHWVWDPNEERKRLERWQQEQERLLKEQYQREQEKLMKEWEKAQLEVEEEERKHNEEHRVLERRILEETVTPLNPTGLLNQLSGQAVTTSLATEDDDTKGRNVPLQHNGQNTATGNEDQHASKLHFFQGEYELLTFLDIPNSAPWETTNQSWYLTNCSPALCLCRCVSGKRLCTGCSEPLGKGAAMIIDTLGLFFHIQCFKCGRCGGQLGDATAGTDVRIRNGLLSCHECYIASRGRGQPTTL
uniref:LIM and calponin homology domains 1a n=1 Tax=Amphilophus citrinellus TaxID=61819 RepID=A0A3Q0SED6_AMPCI